MKEPKSSKAKYILNEAPPSCHIWFVCNGNLIYTRQCSSVVAVDTDPPQLQNSPVIPSAPSWRDYERVDSESVGLFHAPSSNSSSGVSPQSPLIPNMNSDWLRPRGPSLTSQGSACSSNGTVEDQIFPEALTIRGRLGSLILQQNNEDRRLSALPSNPYDEAVAGEMYDRLQQFVSEAEMSRKDAYEESMRRMKAEKDVMDALRRAKKAESMHTEEQRYRKEVEEALSRSKEEAVILKSRLDEVVAELRFALEKKLSLESKIAESDRTAEELKQKMNSAVELLKKYKKERDEMQAERDHVLEEAEELRKKQCDEASSSSSSSSQFFREFSFAELEEATLGFSPKLKIGEGGYGSIYRGNLRHTQVAIKMLNPYSSQGPREFHQEVNILSKVRHPNIVTLMGACLEAWTLVYEYIPNGSLEDRLTCKNNTPPLSWKARIRIATELCSALVFLHSFRPQGIVHGDLKPGNILLDANYVCKLSDFGICRELPPDEFSQYDETRCFRTENPVGTFGYMDPEFLMTGELTSKSDVFSFGVILLRLLTGKSAKGIAHEVQNAIDNGNLNSILDTTAGDWPFVQAKQLAHLGLNCADNNGKNRPNLASQVWRVLEPMKVYCGGSSALQFGCDEEGGYTPSYFVCPIFQEIMQDPVVAADGFTYESEALKGWLESGHDTSPMTNLKLPNTDLVPNHALRSAIQEWLQRT
ncbi:hypothetical protein M569_04335 [Genlisea aurea]|uniref:RING-type E3 ubiquitin transferase n=1 Tax=Genlisea aurea TaxID=192259 RepID=S8E3Z9_9LAMI|nr:hypothetical protein M569_04335 [Genlisea aurea]